MGGSGSGRKPKNSAQQVVGLVQVVGSAKEVALEKRLARTFQEAEEAGTLDDVALKASGGVHRSRSAAWRRAAIVALRGRGYNAERIAELIGGTGASVRTQLYQMRKDGRLDETQDVLNHRIVPMAIDALEADIADPSREGHQDAYLAALHGTGTLSKGGGPRGSGEVAAPALQQLVVNFTLPAGVEKPVLNGQVVGVGRGD